MDGRADVMIGVFVGYNVQEFISAQTFVWCVICVNNCSPIKSLDTNQTHPKQVLGYIKNYRRVSEQVGTKCSRKILSIPDVQQVLRAQVFHKQQ